jgi:SBP domain
MRLSYFLHDWRQRKTMPSSALAVTAPLAASQLHARELMVYVDNVPKRLCQQCSAFHPLADFDGTKK